MIYTSYFANYRKFPPGARIMRISRYAHPRLNSIDLSILAPSAGLLREYKNKLVDEDEYTRKYLEELRQLDKEAVKRKLWQLEEQYGDIVLCCYEKKGSFCHRHILADWLDMGIEEL